MTEPGGFRDLPAIHITQEKTKRKTLFNAPVCIYRGIDDMISHEIQNGH